MKKDKNFKLKEELANHVVKTTQPVVMIDAITKMPSSGGSGCLINYRGRLFFITVQHVADKVGKQTCIDLGKHQTDGNDVYNVGVMNFVDQYEFAGFDTNNPELKELKPLDIAYAEVKGDFEAFQKEMQIGDYRISGDHKRIHFSETPELPNKDECYSFFGRIKGKLKGNVLEQQEKLVFCVPYDRKIGFFERFILHETFSDPADFRGISGAPIISETGEVVAFVANGILGTNHVYGFSSFELKKFLDIYIEQNPVQNEMPRINTENNLERNAPVDDPMMGTDGLDDVSSSELEKIDLVNAFEEEFKSNSGPELTSNPKKDPGGEVTIFYGTNRKRDRVNEPNNFYGDEIADMEVGTCIISIPPGHKQGNRERPSKLLFWQFRENSQKHVVLKAVNHLDQKDFFTFLDKGLQSSEEKAALIFVHGYNTTFAEAAWRTGQIYYDIPFNGIAGFFSWPSTGKTLDYLRDGERADASVSMLEKFIEDIATNTSVKQLHFIAHSMGSRILTRALTKLVIKESFKKSLTSISQVILAAPDIDCEVFKSEILPQFRNIGTRRTLYTNDKDKALRLSQKLRTGLKRLGEAGENIFVDEGIDTIDTSNVMTEGNHHSYMFEAKELLSDLYLVLTKGLKPEERRLRKVPMNSPRYWMFKE